MKDNKEKGTNPWKVLAGIETHEAEGYEVIGPYHDWLRLRGVPDPSELGNDQAVLFNKFHFRFWGGTEVARRDSQAPEIAGYRYSPEREYRVLWLGTYEFLQSRSVFVRLQSMCLNGIVEGSLTCDCGDQFDLSKQMIFEGWTQEQRPGMIILALHHVGKGLGPRNHALIDAMSEQVAIQRGHDSDPARIDRWNEPFVELSGKPGWDELEDMVQIVKHFSITQVNLIASTNNPRKIKRLTKEGFTIERTPLVVSVSRYNRFELGLKQKAGHLIEVVLK